MAKVTLLVERGSGTEPSWQVPYDVTFDPGSSLLDLLLDIREHTDPSLAVRYSCRANACKECSALIDGKVGYLCCEKAKDGERMSISALPKRRRIRDLVTDLG